MRATNPTKLLLVLYGLIASVVLGLEKFNLLPFETSGFLNALLLISLAGALLLETLYEDNKWKDIKSLGPAETISFIVSIVALILAVPTAIHYKIPETLKGVLGFVYLMLASLNLRELFV